MSGRGEDGVGTVALASFEVIAIHAVVGLEVTDHWLNRSAALHLAAVAPVTRRTWLSRWVGVDPTWHKPEDVVTTFSTVAGPPRRHSLPIGSRRASLEFP